MKFSKFLTIVVASNICYCSHFEVPELKSQMIAASLCSMLKQKLKNSKSFDTNRFKESIFIEIPKAIKNCILKQGQFDGIKDIVDFQGTEPRNWTQANWNAVFLYNFLNSVFYLCSSNQLYILKKETDFITLSAIKLKLLYKFGNQFESRLTKAHDDIKKYIQELGVLDWIIEYQKDIDKIPYLDVVNIDKNGNGFVKISFNTIGKLTNKLTEKGMKQGNLYAVIKDNKLSHYVIEIDGEKYNIKIDKYFNLSDVFVPEVNDNFEDSLLDSKQIHPLPNYGGVCWFSSGLWALCASKYYREVIKHMNLIWKLNNTEFDNFNNNISEPISELIASMMKSQISSDQYKGLRKKIDERYVGYMRKEQYIAEYNELYSILENKDIYEFEQKLCELNSCYKMNITEYEGKKPTREVCVKLIKDIKTQIMNSVVNYRELKGYSVEPIIYESLYYCKPKYNRFKLPTNLKIESVDVYTGIVYADIMIDSSEKKLSFLDQISKFFRYNSILQMPSVLLVDIIGSIKEGPKSALRHIEASEELSLRVDGYTYKYRLVSTQCSTSPSGGHYLAEIRTNSGWYAVDDRNRTAKPMKIDFKTNNTGTNRYRNMLIYERVE